MVQEREIQYMPRLADAELESGLSALGAIAIEGPRACGKTSTARQQAVDEIRLDVDSEVRQLAGLDPRLLFIDRGTPLLIDEWQLEPRIWDVVRREIDDRSRPGQFILTGSAMPNPSEIKHRGTGRIGTMMMRPMSLFEQGFSSGGVSLSDLFDSKAPFVGGRSNLSIPDYAERVVIGGWPSQVGATVENSQRFIAGYLETLIEHDISEASATKRDPNRVRRFLMAYAQFTSHTARLTSITERAGGLDQETSLSRPTATEYLDALRRMWIVDDIPAWNLKLRSKSRLMTSEKRRLVDPSLDASLSQANPKRLLRDLETFGFLFESMVTRDVIVYAQANDASVFHYREHDGNLEIDLIVERRDGSWIGIEVKLGSNATEQAAASLIKLSRTRAVRPASALLVVTGTEIAYRRDDGVIVVPLGLLGP